MNNFVISLLAKHFDKKYLYSYCKFDLNKFSITFKIHEFKKIQIDEPETAVDNFAEKQNFETNKQIFI